ncbi:MAG: DUF3568 family protein [Candidatus Omnitrophota bacterium]
MRIYCVVVCCALLAVLTLSGCAPAIILGVGAGAAGGYAISKDTVKADVDKPYEEVWTRSIAVLKDMGTMIVEDKIRGKAEAIIEEAHVWVTVKEVTERTTELKVKARKNWLPKVELAHKISVKILEK